MGLCISIIFGACYTIWVGMGKGPEDVFPWLPVYWAYWDLKVWVISRAF